MGKNYELAREFSLGTFDDDSVEVVEPSGMVGGISALEVVLPVVREEIDLDDSADAARFDGSPLALLNVNTGVLLVLTVPLTVPIL